ncbi:MAG: hypothetical protein J0L92_28810 [Deltaproteobacteria bacterium]|nr:hypothetical protein [Deltaproteobacteria bacterium]
MVNEAGERYTFELDPAGRVVKETGFDGRAREYVRDIAGRPTLTVLPSGRTTTSKYDVMNRLVEENHSDKTFAKFEYAADGLLSSAQNEVSVVEVERDSLGRVVSETVNGRRVASRYDAAGDRTEMTSSLGARVVVDRDSLGQPRDIFFGDASGFKEADVRFDRDALGLESRRSFRNGIDIEWNRDVSGRPIARRTFKRSTGDGTMGFAAGIPAGPSTAFPRRQELDARVYHWRGEEQIAGIVDASSGPKYYDHDRRGRLVRERRPDAVLERAMDAVGNVYRSRTGGDRRYGPGGRLEMADGIRYEHDEDGNQTLKSGRDGNWHYRWNGHGMLREIERPDGLRIAFEYDAFARRIVKRILSAQGGVDREVDFVWDGQNVIHELDSDQGLISWHWEPESFTPVGKEHAGRRWTIASDHLGTPSEMYDELGRLAWKMQLDVLGRTELEAGSPGDCPWRRAGQYDDQLSPLWYNRYRYYDVDTDRYASVDPIHPFGGLRGFAYVADPIWWIDPLGLNTTLGDFGERIARRYAEGLNHTIVGSLQNSSGHGIDLITRDSSGTLHFWEVKVNTARLSPDQRSGAAFIRDRLEQARDGLGHWAHTPNPRASALADSLLTELGSGAPQGSVLRVRPGAHPTRRIRRTTWC